MMRDFSILILSVGMFGAACAQTAQVPANLPAKPSSPGNVASRTVTGPSAVGAIDRGTVAGQTYVNKSFGFEVTFPDMWLVVDDKVLANAKTKGFDLDLKPPKAANSLVQSQLEAAFKRVTVLVSAYRSPPGSPENAVAYVAVEDVRNLNTNRPVKDAVDYVDLIRSTYQSTYKLANMPPDFQYSETEAERLGSDQYAYLDTVSKEGKSRLYVTVRGGYAILFSLNYSSDADLATFRDMLARANFSLK